MLNFKIDKKKCTQCGICSTECPTLIINGKNGIPEIKEGKEGNCIQCQHCLAVCPTGALSIFGKNPEDSLQVTNEIPTAMDMERLIKTRRSVRRFKKEVVSEEVLQQLVDTAAYAPTGHNKNQVLITLSYTQDELNKVRDLVYGAIKTAIKNDTLPESAKVYRNFLSLWENKGVDVLFRNAPHVIIASAPKSNGNGVADCVISLSYFELIANTLGIATLWDGLAKVVFDNIDPELQTRMGIPTDHTIGYMMVFGKPAIKFARSIQSEGLNLNRIQ